MKKKFSFLIASIVFITIAFAKSNENKTSTISKTHPRKINTVIIFGNSIVAHQVAPAIGWNGDWGMAASVRDSDFVHLLIADIQNVDKSINIRFLNISVFENYYDTYNFSQLADYRNADMIIVKISENVKSETAVKKDFVSHYKSIVIKISAARIQIKCVRHFMQTYIVSVFSIAVTSFEIRPGDDEHTSDIRFANMI